MKNLFKKKPSSLFAFNCCCQGASHIKNGTVCQDFAASTYGEKYAVAVVCDGHGGDVYFRSDAGARFAVETAMESIQTFMRECIQKSKFREQVKNESDRLLQQLEKNILYKWNNKIEQHLLENPLTENELGKLTDADRKKIEQPDYRRSKIYGTTLIAIVVYPPHFWYGVHIGDGKCVALFDDDTFVQPIPWDDQCFLNTTTSMCDANALENFRHCLHIDRFPVGLFVGSDGVDDSFKGDGDLHGFYRELMRSILENGKEKAIEEIRSSLPVISQRGSQDDISVAGIINKPIY